MNELERARARCPGRVADSRVATAEFEEADAALLKYVQWMHDRLKDVVNCRSKDPRQWVYAWANRQFSTEYDAKCAHEMMCTLEELEGRRKACLDKAEFYSRLARDAEKLLQEHEVVARGHARAVAALMFHMA